jgi:hypothetical protein
MDLKIVPVIPRPVKNDAVKKPPRGAPPARWASQISLVRRLLSVARAGKSFSSISIKTLPKELVL